MHPGRQLAVLGLIFVVLYSSSSSAPARAAASPTGCTRSWVSTWSAAPRRRCQAPTARRPAAVAREHGAGPADHREPGQRPRRLRGRGGHRGRPQHRHLAARPEPTTSSRTSARPRSCGSARCSRRPATWPPTAVNPPSAAAQRRAERRRTGERTGGHRRRARRDAVHRRPGRRRPAGRARAEHDRRPRQPTPAPSESAAAPVTADEQAPASPRCETKVGAAAWAAAAQADRPGRPEPATRPPARRSSRSRTLTPAEVAALPPAMQFNVPTISCDQLDKRPPGSIDDAEASRWSPARAAQQVCCSTWPRWSAPTSATPARSSTSSRASGWSSSTSTATARRSGPS